MNDSLKIVAILRDARARLNPKSLFPNYTVKRIDMDILRLPFIPAVGSPELKHFGKKPTFFIIQGSFSESKTKSIGRFSLYHSVRKKIIK